MKYIFLVFLVFLAFSCSSQVPQTDEEAGVHTLTTADFDEFLNKNTYTLIEFYAPWCGHCKKLVPEWQYAAFHLKESGVPLAKIDTTIHKEIGQRYDIKGFPTILFFENGNRQDYTGDRTGDNIVKWVKKQVGQFSVHIQSSENLDSFKSENKLAVVLFTQNPQGKDWQTWEQLAKNYQKINFAHITDARLQQQEQVQFGNIVIYKQYDDLKNVYTGEITVESFSQFLDTKFVPIVMEFDDIGVEAVFRKKNPTLFYFNNNSEEAEQQVEIFRKVAVKNHGGLLKYAITAPNDGHGQWDLLLRYLRFQEQQTPMVLFVHFTPTEVKKDRLEGEVNEQSIQAFIDKYNGNSNNGQAQQQQENKHSDL